MTLSRFVPWNLGQRARRREGGKGGGGKGGRGGGGGEACECLWRGMVDEGPVPWQ